MLFHVAMRVNLPPYLDPHVGDESLFPYLDIEVTPLARHPSTLPES